MDREPGQLSPQTIGLLRLAATALLLFAGAMALLAFGVGLVREGLARWLLLVMAGIFLIGPVIIRRMGTATNSSQAPRS